MKKSFITYESICKKFSEGKICVFVWLVNDETMLNIGQKLGYSKPEELIGFDDKLMVEFSNIKEANSYLMSFRGEWLDVFYVSLWVNGEFQSENT